MSNENLKVDHKTVLEEFKRKHNYIVDFLGNGTVHKISAPSSTTLTDEEIELITKGIFIEGDFLGFKNPILLPAFEEVAHFVGVIIGSKPISGGNSYLFTTYAISKDTKSITSPTSSKYIYYDKVNSFNGKELPVYPADNLNKYLKSEQGTLKWEDINLANIVDNQGNNRFIEGDITIETITGVTQTYGKWSLSGTHLMIVVAGRIVNGTQTSNLGILANITLPEFILDKLVPIFTTLLDYKSPVAYADNLTTQAYPLSVQKGADKIQLRFESNVTTSADRKFRWQFDFLIDNE